ncbi:UxaA family hydrolase [uncultured Veillonella sp.]|uniref:UxaA family hydrolase n=1 Tax=uncultured Veillonella sp. TaxID=159268 RepID=UPI00259674EC|nr:UxaA family hydrolase [uncultured Veillonella sp.]
MNAVMTDKKDTVAVVIEPIHRGDVISYKMDNDIKTITALDDIMIYHKVAIHAMKKGSPVVKYGEHIGLAAKDIQAGEHVHEHNVESHRENL